MGETFCNLNLRTEDLSSVRALFPGCTAVSPATGWVTVAGGKLRLEAIRREARRASLTLPCPVLSTEFFDGDFARFTLFLGGHKAAEHIPAAYGEINRWPGRPGTWAKILGLSREDRAALGVIFREESPAAALELLSCLLGCPLDADPSTIGELPPPDRDFLDAYLVRRRAEDNIKNQTDLTLLDQVTAPCDPDWDTDGYPFVLRVGPGSQVYSFWDFRDGRLVKLFERAFPEGEEPDSDWDDTSPLGSATAVCRTRDGRLITLAREPGEDLWSLLSFRPDGRDVIRQRLLSIYHWDRALTDGERVYFAQNERLCCMDSRLTPLWDMDLGEYMEQMTFSPLMDVRSGRVWYGTLRGITSVDLAVRRVAARLTFTPPDRRSLWDILPGVGVLTAASPSSFEVRDLDLNIISRHRTRGAVSRVLPEKDRTLLVTSGRSRREAAVTLRLYEVRSKQ